MNWQVITDTRTGLVWSKEINNTKVNWEEAKQYCENLTTWWKTNWRLPDITELRSIVNDSCYNPNSYEEFNFVGSSHYWSSVATADNSDDVWYLNFGDGNTYRLDKIFSSYVLCVAN